MRLISAQVVGFQSFSDSGKLDFRDGINLVIGQNNAGKSALLRALQPLLSDDRHRTPGRHNHFELLIPRVQLLIDINGSELREVMFKRSHSLIPISPIDGTPERLVEKLFTEKHIVVPVNHAANVAFTGRYPIHGQFVAQSGQQQIALQVSSQDGKFVYSRQHVGTDSFGELLYAIWCDKFFYFSAERLGVGESAFSHALRLEPDARNLPAVLLTLKGDRGSIFDRLVSHLRVVFPTIGNISVTAKAGSGLIEIRVWPTMVMENVLLSFPLSSSGTGVAQVIAILTAVMTSSDTLIAIDEINSFLHPAAVKALLRILQTYYAQHQYIISTHAPEVISFSNPSTIHLVERHGYESYVSKLDLKKTSEFRDIAAHLGVSMADVFAAENVIWVEGPTEELCFPYLYELAGVGTLPQGLIFTAVSATGDFNSKNRQDRARIYDLYRRLTGAATTLKVGTAFSFDTEMTTEAQKEEMRKESGQAMHFLPRRHLECYAIHAGAMYDLIIFRDPSLTSVVTEEAVAAKLMEVSGRPKYLVPSWNGDTTADTWQTHVDAAKLIGDVIGEVSNQQVIFKKTSDTLKLLQAIQLREPSILIPLVNYVKDLVATLAGPTSSP